MSKTVWIVGQSINAEISSWHFQGVFETENEALDACFDENYFVGPAILGESLPHEIVEWVGAYYPIDTYDIS